MLYIYIYTYVIYIYIYIYSRGGAPEKGGACVTCWLLGDGVRAVLLNTFEYRCQMRASNPRANACYPFSVYLPINLYLSLSIYIYIYMYTYVYLSIYRALVRFRSPKGWAHFSGFNI